MFWIKFDECVLKIDENNIDAISAEQDKNKEWTLNILFSSGESYTVGYYNYNNKKAIQDRDTLLGLLGCVATHTIEDIQNLTLNNMPNDNIQPTENSNAPSRDELLKLSDPKIEAKKILADYFGEEAKKYKPTIFKE